MDYRKYLLALMNHIKGAQTKSYSYIQFTKDLGLGDCNTMFLIIHKGRPLSDKNARKVADHIGLKNEFKKYFLNLVTFQMGKKDEERQKAFQKLSLIKAKSVSKEIDKKSLEFFTQWYHSAIYEILSITDIPQDEKWISSHLSPTVSPKKVSESLELMVEIGMVLKDPQTKRFVPSDSAITTGREVYGMVFTAYHKQMIGLAEEALSKVPAHERDFNSVTVSIREDKLNELKNLSEEFVKKMLELSENGESNNRVYQINVQAFPLTKALRKER